jgi:hypothetical protein
MENPRVETESNTQYIYLLLDPRNNQPVYVGKAKCVISRLGLHLCVKAKHNPAFYAFIEELKRSLLIPKIQILETTDDDHATERETFWIGHYFSLYPNLYNRSLRPKSMLKTKQYVKTLKRN